MRASDLPAGMNTAGFRWRDPAETSPPGLLAGDPALHSRGGLRIRADAVDTGIEVGLLGDPALRDWPDGVPIQGMPLRRNGAGEFWAPPYPTVVFAQRNTAAITLAAPTGKAGDTTLITSPLAVSVRNATPYSMMLVRRVSVRAAKLMTPRKSVSYDLVIDGATSTPWPVLTGTPDRTVGVIAPKQSGTIDGTQKAFVTDVTVIDSVNQAVHAGSATLTLPTLLIEPGGSYDMTVATAVTYYQDVADPFDVQVGETWAEIAGWAIPNTDFGQEA